MHNAWYVEHGAWFRISGRYIVPATPPTVFTPILFKLYRCFNDGLKICIYFFQNPEIILSLFFAFLSQTFRALVLQKCIGSMQLVPATSPTVLGRSF